MVWCAEFRGLVLLLGAWLLVVVCCFTVVGVLIMLLVFVSFAVAWAAVFVYGLLAYLIWLGSMWYLVLWICVFGFDSLSARGWCCLGLLVFACLRCCCWIG